MTTRASRSLSSLRGSPIAVSDVTGVSGWLGFLPGVEAEIGLMQSAHGKELTIFKIKDGCNIVWHHPANHAASREVGACASF
jgi:hypothetical protein